MRIDLHPCYILHKKAYRETSLLLEIFSRVYGRVGVVAKGAASKKAQKQYLQPFMSLQLAWSGKGELGTLINAEPDGLPTLLTGDNLFSGYYINELLMRLLHRHDPHPELFQIYQLTLRQMAETSCLESVLRSFEKKLLDELGYGLILDHETESGARIIPEQDYVYLSGSGPFLRNSPQVKDNGVKIKGHTLLSLATGIVLENKQSRGEAKRLMRYLLAPLIGDKPLQSRRVFEKMKI